MLLYIAVPFWSFYNRRYALYYLFMTFKVNGFIAYQFDLTSGDSVYLFKI